MVMFMKTIMFVAALVLSFVLAYFAELDPGRWCLAGEIVRVGGGRLLDNPIDLCAGVAHVPGIAVAKFLALWSVAFAAMFVIVVLPIREQE